MAEAGGFGADETALAHARTQVAQVAEELAAERARLQDSVGGFLGSGWTGAAAEDYARGWQEWEKGAEDVMTALSTMGDLLAQTRAAYVASDGEAAERQARFQARLGGGAV